MSDELKNYSFFDSTLKQKVLNFMTENKGKEFSIKDLNKLLDLPASSLSVTLSDLEAQNIVESRKEGKYKYYRLTEEMADTFQRIYRSLETVYAATLRTKVMHDSKSVSRK